jgi:hypothetical protein
MSAWEESVRQFYVNGFRKHYEDVCQASSQNLELWEFLEAQGIELQGDIVIEFFLNVNALGWMKEPNNRIGIPEQVLEAYDFYVGREQVKVAKVSIEGGDTYAVRTGTPGEGGWLEVFDDRGKMLGSAMTLVDVVSWEEQRVIRNKFKMRDSILSDWYRMRELSLFYPSRKG